MNNYNIDFSKVFNSDYLVPAEQYESPITLIRKEVENAYNSWVEDNVFKMVSSLGIKVDKDELVKALKYDRQQYERGYNVASLEFQNKALDAMSKVSLAVYNSDNPQYKKAMEDALSIMKSVWLSEDSRENK
ncbi:MAG: hypothetical protein LIR46_08040 [Bacteroidota bacterium]|nr:hypothetical protein [Bacteroidota bacterium]